MKCAEVVERLPDEAPEIRAHVAGCLSCRDEMEAFERDGELLSEGLRAEAGEAPKVELASRRPAWRWLLPLAAASVFAAILLQVVQPPPSLRAPAPAEDLPTSGGELVILGDDPLWGQVIAVDLSAGTVAVSVGRAHNVVPGLAVTLYRGSEEVVGKLVIEKTEEGWSTARLREQRMAPQVGDYLLCDRLLDEGERRAFLAYLFTFRPLTGRDEADVRALVAKIDSGDRESASALAAAGAPARIVFERIEPDLGVTARVRARAALGGGERVDGLVRGAGLDHDVQFLARLRDPRARARLQAILSRVEPFEKPGLREQGMDLREVLHDWWIVSKDRVCWDAEADRYFPK